MPTLLSSPVTAFISKLLLCGAGLSLASLFAANPAHAQYVYTDINAPLADPTFVGTTALGISNAGVIVGTYEDVTHHSNGFVDANGAFVTADYPGGALSTTPSGINTTGQIVGNAFDASGYSTSYLETGGVYQSVNDPNGYSGTTSLRGINDSGQIVGSYNAPGSGQFATAVGFVYTGGVFTDLNIPGFSGALPTAINNLGQIAGNYSTSSGGQYGFFDSNGVVSTVNVPGAVQTTITGLNDAGDIVGEYTDASRNQHGFVLTGNVFTTVDDPNAAPGPFTYNRTLSYVTGINDANQIVGYYYDANDYSHGFEAVSSPVPESSTSASLGLLLTLSFGGAGVAACRKKASSRKSPPAKA